VQRLIVYASLKADEDRAAAHDQQRMQQANALLALVDENTAWVEPEILAIGAGKIAALKNADKNLALRFGFYLDNMLRAAPHALGAEGEAAIALTEDIQQQPGYIYGQLSDSELPYPVIKLSDGTEVRLDSAAYEKYRQVENRADRKLVFDSFWNAWKQFEGTTGGILTSEATKNEFLAKVRKFPGVLPSQLFDDNLPEVIYKTLVAQANAGLPTLHRYFGLRKKLLGIQDELDYYDVYPSMFTSESVPRFSLPDAQAITFEALKPYGESTWQRPVLTRR